MTRKFNLNNFTLMKSTISFFLAALVMFALSRCTSGNQSQENGTNTATIKKDSTHADKGIGKFTNVPLTHPLDDSMVARGSSIYDSKCISCHKLTDEKLVGPGWKDVTTRRTPEWIMNFITNTNVMLDSDLVAQQVMVTCV